MAVPSCAVMPGVPGRWLAAAWRESAEHGDPACLLIASEGAVVVGWANRAMGDLTGLGVADLVGQPLSVLVTPDDEPDDEPAEDGGEPVPGWARLSHRLAMAGGGSGVGTLSRVEGAATSVRVVVTAVITMPDVAPPVPRQSKSRGGKGSTPSDAPPRRGRVPRPGVVGELASAEPTRCWLVEVRPVDEALAQAETALAMAEHRFRALAGCAPVGIFVSDVGLRLGFVNDWFVTLTGTSAASLLGTGWLDVVHRDDLTSVYSAVQTVLGGTPVELAVRLATMDGLQRWLQLRLAPTTTPSRAAGFIGTAEDVTDRRSWEEHLTYQAYHDPLTGLVNRRRLIEVLTELLSSRRGRDREFAVLFLDLDGFKGVNDTYGHDAGDRALVEIASRMRRVARESDLLARVAGDEFVVVLRNITGEPEAEAAARRHLAALAEPVRIGSAELRLSASIGVALPTGFDTPDSLLRAADRVMYEAKAAGSGLYRLAPVGPGREDW